jgi:arsenite-transporting ATPase
MACATALQLQRQYPDLRLLLFSTDPAHSLSDCLKLKLQALPT